MVRNGYWDKVAMFLVRCQDDIMDEMRARKHPFILFEPMMTVLRNAGRPETKTFRASVLRLQLKKSMKFRWKLTG